MERDSGNAECSQSIPITAQIAFAAPKRETPFCFRPHTWPLGSHQQRCAKAAFPWGPAKILMLCAQRCCHPALQTPVVGFALHPIDNKLEGVHIKAVAKPWEQKELFPRWIGS